MNESIAKIAKWKLWLVIPITLFILLVALLVLGLVLRAQSAADLCLRDAADFDQPNICNAKDVPSAAFELAEGVKSCIPGEEIQVKIRARVSAGSSQRYDLGFYVAKDGGDAVARGTSCFRDYLHPVSPENGQDLDPLGGLGSFYNAEVGLPDTCGDIEASSDAVYLLNSNNPITIICRDDDGDGTADVGTVVTWDVNDQTNCEDEDDTVPDQPSKCEISVTNIAGLLLPQSAAIEVIKDREPDGDPGLFNLQIDGEDKATDAGEGEGTGPVPVTAGTTAEPGDTHAVGETAGTDTDLANYDVSILCVYRDTDTEVASGSGSHSLTVPVQPDDDIVCTITNDRHKVTTFFEKRVEDGDAKPSDWTFTVDGQTAGHGSSLALYPGDYTVTEDGGAKNTADYQLAAASGACSLQDGQIGLMVTDEGGICTVTNSRSMGSLDVVKVVNDESQWIVSYAGPASGSSELGNGDHLGPDDVPTGTYDVSEVPAAGTDGSLYASSGSCVGSDGSGTPSADGRTITGVVIQEGEEVVCTFTNSQARGSVTIIKQTNPPDADTAFEFVSNVAPASFSLSDGDSQQFLDLPDGGTYSFAETVPGGWVLEQAGCTGDDSSEISNGDSGVSIILAPNEDIVCTFVDSREPAIQVTKEADPEMVLEPGDTVTFTVTVKNDSIDGGSVKLTGLEDDLYGDLADPSNSEISDSDCELGPISAGDAYICTFRAGVYGNAGDQVTDIVTATGTLASGSELTDSDDATVAIVVVPPDTGVELPRPFITGALAALGAALLLAGVVLLQRSKRSA
ncbi:hypothetical protein ACFLYD_06645 [Chloroflexota bacterium]